MKGLRLIPMDGTFNQTAPVKRLAKLSVSYLFLIPFNKLFFLSTFPPSRRRSKHKQGRKSKYGPVSGEHIRNMSMGLVGVQGRTRGSSIVQRRQGK